MGGKGSQLSGGQKRKWPWFMFEIQDSCMVSCAERIAIARALLRNPKVLLLDEVGFMDGLEVNWC